MSFVEPRGDALTIRASQAFAVGAASAQSAALSGECRIVRVCATTSCYIAAGPNPTATASDILLPANTEIKFTVKAGWRIAAIRVSADGICNVVEAL